MSPLAFAIPAALGALALVAAPVVVHMIRRTTARRLEFPSLRFLGETASRARRFKLPNRKALLVLRVLVVALVALAFARPVWVGGAAPGVAVVILLDASASMRREDARADAVEAARRAIDALGPRDRVRVGTFDRGVTWLGEMGDAKASRAALASYEPGLDTATPGPAVDAASRELVAMPASTRRIVIVSDFQRSNGPWDASRVDPSVEVRAVAVGSAYENAFITGIESAGTPEKPVLAIGLVRAGADGRDAKVVVVPARDGASGDGVRVSATGDGWNVAVVGADGFDADDTTRVSASRRTRVVVVDPDDPFLPAAASAVFGDSVVEPATVDAAALDGASHAIAGQRALERSGASAALDAWIRAGGRAVVFAPAPAQWAFPSAHGNVLASVAPVRAAAAPDDALDRALLGSSVSGARAVGATDGDVVVLRDATGAPLAVRRALGSGSVTVVGFDVSSESLPLVRDPSFPPFVAWLVEDAGRSAEVTASVPRAESEPALMSADEVERTVAHGASTSVASSPGSLDEAESRQGLWRYALVAVLLLALLELAAATRATARGVA